MGRLHTCYSPVRRSPPSDYSSCAAPRLACVKPIASVHPEPGSNSSLSVCFLLYPLLLLYYPFNSLTGTFISFTHYSSLQKSENHCKNKNACTTYNGKLSKIVVSFISHFLEKADTKIRQFLIPHKYFICFSLYFLILFIKCISLRKSECKGKTFFYISKTIFRFFC